MRKLRVLLADDHKVVREGLRLLISGRPDMTVVAEAANGKEVLRQVREFDPDVVVMDLSMPELNGFQTTLQLKAEHPKIRVLALTAHEDESYLRQVCRAGAAGFVLKRAAGEELIEAIRTVAGGGLYYDARLTAKALVHQLTNPAAGESRPGKLSQREQDVLTLLAWGFSNKEAAAKLNLSVKTVETYRVRIAEKLGLRSRTAIVQYALRQGWLSETEPPPRLAA